MERVFSRLGEEGSYVPRAVFTDLEPSVVDAARDKFKGLCNPANFITAEDGAGSNFAVAYRGLGVEVNEKVLDVISREIENCDSVGGVFLLHSLGGGTGSGLGALIIESLKEKYPHVPLISCAILPSAQVSSVVTEPYNTVFALDTLKDCCDACLIFDNEALFNLAQRHWGMESPTVEDLNLLITEVLTGLTASMRYSGFLTVEMSVRELLTNLIPHPNLHFLVTSAAPLTRPDESKFTEVSVDDLTESLFSDESMYTACSPSAGKYLSLAVLYRGAMDDRAHANEVLAEARKDLPLSSWIPTAFKIGYVGQRGLVHHKSMVLIANNTEVATALDRLCQNFDKLWERKAFANWYLSEGMEEEEIAEMRENVGELVREYRAAAVSGREFKDQASKPAEAAAPAAPAAPKVEPPPIPPVIADPEPDLNSDSKEK